MSLATSMDHVRRLLRLMDELRRGSEENKAQSHERRAALNDEFTRLRSDARQQADRSLAALQNEFTEKLEAHRIACEQRLEELEANRAAKSDELSRFRATTILRAKDDGDTNQMRLRDESELDQRELRKRHQQWKQRCEEAQAELADVRDATDQLLDRFAVLLLEPAKVKLEPAIAKLDSKALVREMHHLLEQQNLDLLAVHQWRSVRWLRQGASFLAAFLGAAIVAWPIGYATNYQPLLWTVGVAIVLIVTGLGTWQWILSRIRKRLWEQVPLWSERFDRGVALIAESECASEQETDVACKLAQQRAHDEIKRTKEEQVQRVKHAESDYARQTRELEEAVVVKTRELETQWEQATDAVRREYLPQIKQRTEFFERQARQLEQDYEQRLARVEREELETREGLRERWQIAIRDYDKFLALLHDQPGVAPGWSEMEHWVVPTETPDAIAFGRYALRLRAEDREWAGDHLPADLPALLSFGDQPSLILKATDEGRQAAVKALQAATLHLLASFPPGTVRLTVFDPMGLGENFSALMHLADYDERLVSHRIWTETAHLQQRLVDLTEHMENVIQKYLRNQYASIQDYNRYAGEVAEPFRILVIANFPHQFSDEAMRRLVRILQTGPRCGVFTLMSIDEHAKWPRAIPPQDLEQNAQVLQWRDGRFVHQSEPWSELPLELDMPPEEELATRLLTAIGQHAQDHRRVEVPFTWVAPSPERYWTYDCSEELTVPLGRSGATQQLSLSLGRGTSQHVLIAGKTGSGKSTLLHALITNAALRYSPDEVQFYLVDFKKGVEFKPYATNRLVHAAIVAIESEREFGLSVLQRLDQELRRRGDTYRDAGVQNLAMFRQAHPGRPMPRILLVVDEFQEFFVKDDRVAHEASLLLDRLVRQGRAFGIHVILGSQTLAGAYSLARSTLGQMAVRIALECSAADAHVILSEDNTAARLLGRPGEAIYNDANGMLEGNHPFQVVWLPDAQRNAYLHQVAELAQRDRRSDPPPIVFEGQAAADLRENSELLQVIEQGKRSGDVRLARAWLGAAVEIKEPVSALFRRQSGTNLLLVGSNGELAEGMLASSVLSLTLPSEPTHPAPRLVMLYPEPIDEQNGVWVQSMRDALACTIDVALPTQAAEMVAQLAELVEQRLNDSDSSSGESVFLMIHDLARFRALQPDPDDFGLGSFSSERAAGNAAAQFARILREGPAVGVHTIVWADCYHTVSRWFERATVRDFAQRVLMQMSAVDSSHLMDSVAASQLGPFRAIFHDHDRGASEKFRPYGVPDFAWLEDLKRKSLAGR